MKTTLTCSTLVVAGVLAAQAQPFQNLGFDEANTNTTVFSIIPDIFVLGGQGPTSDLLPGWQLFKGSDPVPKIGLAVPGAPDGGPGVGLTSKELSPSFVEGKYALGFGSNAEDKPWSLVQRGDIPANAAFLSFKTGPRNPFKQLLQPMVNGKELPILLFPPASFGPDRLVFDVSAFAGQNAELRFTFNVDTSPRSLDDIRFVVPEPTQVSIAILGLLLPVAWRSMMTHRRQRRVAPNQTSSV